MDYGTLNLNTYLLPENAPITQNKADFWGAYDFNSLFDRGIISSGFVQEISANLIRSGSVVVSLSLGTSGSSGSVILDGANNRIIINDGTTDRILIGKQTSGF